MNIGFKFKWFTPLLLILLHVTIMVIISLPIVLFSPLLRNLVVQVPAFDKLFTQMSLLLTILISYKFFNNTSEILNLKISIRKLLFLILVGCGLFTMNVAVMSLLGNPLPKSPYNNPLSQIISFVSIFMASIVEELLFRGIIFNNLVKRYSFWISAIYSSILFALVHVSVIKLIPTFIVGMVLCWVLKKEQKIIYCILIHFIINILSEIAYYIR
jgi:membrane protease YdiL (CAAX protease family)